MGDAKKYIIPVAIAFVAGGFNPAGAFMWTKAFMAAALTAVSIALTPEPEVPDFGFAGQESDRTRTFRQPITVRKLAYGHIKAGGPIIYVSTTAEGDKQNTFLHMVTVHASNEARSISKYFINEQELSPSDLDANGVVNTGLYEGVVRISSNLGATDQEADALLIADGPAGEWTTKHRLRGIFNIYWRFKWSDDLGDNRQAPFKKLPQVAVTFYAGKGIYDPRTAAASTTAAQETNSALVLRDYLTNSFGLNAPTSAIDDTNFITAANICDEQVQYWDTSSVDPARCTITETDDTFDDENDGDEYTTPAMDLGSESSSPTDRIIVAQIFVGGNQADVTGVTLDGSAMTIDSNIIGGIDANGVRCVVAHITKATGTTGVFVVTLDENTSWCHLKPYALQNSSGTVTHKATSISNDNTYVGDLSCTVQFNSGAAMLVSGAKDNNANDGGWSGHRIDGDPDDYPNPAPITNFGFSQSPASETAEGTNKAIYRGWGINNLGIDIADTTTIIKNVVTGECSMSAVCFEPANAKVTQARYASAGLVDTGRSARNNLQDILTSMGGTLVYSNGKFKCLPASPSSISMSLNEDDFVGDVAISPNLSRRDNFNTVVGTYIAPENDYQPSNYPAATSATFKTQDNGEELTREFVQPFTTDPERAQRIAKLTLFRNRQPLAFSSTLRLTAFSLDIGDVVKVSLDKYGWSEKLFEVKSYGFASTGESLNIAMTFKEYADDIYDWSKTDQEIIDSAPNTTLPVFTSTQPPTDLVATETLVTTRDGRGVQSLLTVTFNAANDAFVSYYELEYKKTSSSTYIGLASTDARAFEILDLAPDTYDIRVRSVNVFNTLSSFVSIQKTTYGLLAAPSAMTNLSAQDVGGLCFLQWTLSTDLDVRVGGHVEIRFQGVTTGAAWTDSQLVDDSITGMSTSAIVPLRAGTYLCKFVDSSGTKQGSATSVVSDGATILDFTDDQTVTENPSFAGTKTNCFVDTATTPDSLNLDAGGNLDAVTDFDLIDNFDFLGGVVTSATYEFASKMDHSSVKRIRITGNMASEIYIPAGTLIDSRATVIDTWEDFDETGDATPVNVIFYYSHTADDPATATDWSVWKRFTQREERARGVKFKLEFTNTDSVYNIRVNTLSAVSAVI